MGPLDGVRILDFSRLAPGPYGSMLLADLGADVIRVDRAPVRGGGASPFGDVVARGKRSIAIDLKAPGAIDVAMRLVDWADVVLEGFRPGVMERNGLGPDDCLQRNPRIVYARMTGWGQDGPLADRAGHDIDYIAIGGVLGAIGRKGERPVPPLNIVGDFAGGGLLCAFGIVCALLERERSGKGQVIDVAMVDGAISFLSFFAGQISSGMWGPRGTNMLDTGAPFYDVYETKDGRHMAVGAIEPQFYAELLDGLGLSGEDLPGQMDPSGWETLRTRFAEAFSGKTRDEWANLFEDRDACVYPVLDPAEALGHRHNVARRTHVEAGGVRQPAPVPRFDRTPGRIGSTPPAAGEHSRQILSDLGFDDQQIDKLGADGVVGWR